MSISSRGNARKTDRTNLSIIIIGLIISIDYAKATIDYAAHRKDAIARDTTLEGPTTTRDILEDYFHRNVTSVDDLQTATEHILHYGALLRNRIIDTFGKLVYDNYDDFGMSQIEALYRVYRETLERKYNIFDIVPRVLNDPDTRPTKICRYIYEHVETCLKESSTMCMDVKIHDESHDNTLANPELDVVRRIYESTEIATYYPRGFSSTAILNYLKSGELRLTWTIFAGLLMNAQYDNFDDKVRRAEREIVIFLTNERREFDEAIETTTIDAGTVGGLLRNLLNIGKSYFTGKTLRHADYLAEHVVREVDAISENIALLGTVYDNSTVNLKYLFELILPNDVMDSDVLDARDYLLEQIRDKTIVENYLKIEKYQQTGPDQLIMEIFGQLRDINFAEDIVTSLYAHARFWHRSHRIKNMNDLLELFDAYENLRGVPDYRRLVTAADEIRSDLANWTNITVELLCSRPRSCLRIGLRMIRNCDVVSARTKRAIDEFTACTCECSCQNDLEVAINVTAGLSTKIETITSTTADIDDSRDIRNIMRETLGDSTTPLTSSVDVDLTSQNDDYSENSVEIISQVELGNDYPTNSNETYITNGEVIVGNFTDRSIENLCDGDCSVDECSDDNCSVEADGCVGANCSNEECTGDDCPVRENCVGSECIGESEGNDCEGSQCTEHEITETMVTTVHCNGSDCQKSECENSECPERSCEDGNCSDHSHGNDDCEGSDCSNGSCEGEDCDNDSEVVRDCEGPDCRDETSATSDCKDAECQDKFMASSDCEGSGCQDTTSVTSDCEGPGCEDESDALSDCIGLDCPDTSIAISHCEGPDCEHDSEINTSGSVKKDLCHKLNCSDASCSSCEGDDHRDASAVSGNCPGPDCEDSSEVRPTGFTSQPDCVGLDCTNSICEGDSCRDQSVMATDCEGPDCLDKFTTAIYCEGPDCQDKSVVTSDCDGPNCQDKSSVASDCEGPDCQDISRTIIDCEGSDCQDTSSVGNDCEGADCHSQSLVETVCEGSDCQDKSVVVSDCEGPDCQDSSGTVLDCEGPDCQNEFLLETDCEGPDCRDKSTTATDCEGPDCHDQILVVTDCEGPDCQDKSVVASDCEGPDCQDSSGTVLDCEGPDCQDTSSVATDCEGPNCQNELLLETDCDGPDCRDKSTTATDCEGPDCQDNSMITSDCEGPDCQDNSETAIDCEGPDCKDSSSAASDCEGAYCLNESVVTNDCEGPHCEDKSAVIADCEGADCQDNSDEESDCEGPNCQDESASASNCEGPDCTDNSVVNLSASVEQNQCHGPNCPESSCVGNDCEVNATLYECEGSGCLDDSQLVGSELIVDTQCNGPNCLDDKITPHCNGSDCSIQEEVECEGDDCSDEPGEVDCETSDCRESDRPSELEPIACQGENCTDNSCEGTDCPGDVPIMNCTDANCTDDTAIECDGSDCSDDSSVNCEGSECLQHDCNGSDCVKNVTTIDCIGPDCSDDSTDVACTGPDCPSSTTNRTCIGVSCFLKSVNMVECKGPHCFTDGSDEEPDCEDENCSDDSSTAQSSCEGASCEGDSTHNDSTDDETHDCEGSDCNGNAEKSCKDGDCPVEQSAEVVKQDGKENCTCNCTRSVVLPIDVAPAPPIKFIFPLGSTIHPHNSSTLCGNRDPHYRRQLNRLQKMRRIDAESSTPRSIWKDWNVLFGTTLRQKERFRVNKGNNLNTNVNTNVIADLQSRSPLLRVLGSDTRTEETTIEDEADKEDIIEEKIDPKLKLMNERFRKINDKSSASTEELKMIDDRAIDEDEKMKKQVRKNSTDIQKQLMKNRRRSDGKVGIDIISEEDNGNEKEIDDSQMSQSNEVTNAWKKNVHENTTKSRLQTDRSERRRVITKLGTRGADSSGNKMNSTRKKMLSTRRRFTTRDKKIREKSYDNKVVPSVYPTDSRETKPWVMQQRYIIRAPEKTSKPPVRSQTPKRHTRLRDDDEQDD